MRTRPYEEAEDQESCIERGRDCLLRANAETRDLLKKLALATEAMAWFQAADFCQED